MSIVGNVSIRSGAGGGAMNSLTKIGLFLLNAMAVVWLTACSESSVPDAADPQAAAPNRLPVRVSYLEDKAPSLYQTFIGTARAANRVTIRSQVSGRLLEREVKLGSQVKQGEVLAKVYNPGATPQALAAKQRWQQARVQVSQAQRDYDRIKSLYEKNVASIQEMESARSAVQAAQAATDAAESQYVQAQQMDAEQTIRAPFAGVITATPVEPGEVIQVGQPLLQLADPDEVEIEVIVSDGAAASVAAGDVLTVRTPFSGERQFAGVVHEVTPFRERGALPTVIVRLADAGLIPGTTVHIQFESALAGQFVLPASSLVKTGRQQSAVYRVTADNQVELVPVQPLQVINDKIVINGPLQAQDAVVVAGNHQLYPGADVEVVQ
ncbi:MAG: efflux RND transporter periplasmic adaptor subunit [Ketobacter sp.]|nr:MAG: efflux RND transporter periplasmic adaptor subunit [Ketobacter sp.]